MISILIGATAGIALSALWFKAGREYERWEAGRDKEHFARQVKQHKKETI